MTPDPPRRLNPTDPARLPVDVERDLAREAFDDAVDGWFDAVDDLVVAGLAYLRIIVTDRIVAEVARRQDGGE